MFALRELAKNPIPVKVLTYRDHVELSLRTFLPERERIVLETFAWPHKTIVDMLKWDIPTFVWPYIQAKLKNLGAIIAEVQYG